MDISIHFSNSVTYCLYSSKERLGSQLFSVMGPDLQGIQFSLSDARGSPRPAHTCAEGFLLHLFEDVVAP